GGVVDVADDAVRRRIARADAGQEQQVADAARVRIGADRFRRVVGVDDAVHGAAPSMTTSCAPSTRLPRSVTVRRYFAGRRYMMLCASPWPCSTRSVTGVASLIVLSTTRSAGIASSPSFA